MIERRERCDGCRTTHPLADLLIVRDRHDASRPSWNLCRPQTPGRPYGECLRVAAPSAADYSIALAAQEAVHRHAVTRGPGVPTGVPDLLTTVSKLGFHTDESPDPPKRMQSPHIHARE